MLQHTKYNGNTFENNIEATSIHVTNFAARFVRRHLIGHLSTTIGSNL